MRIIVERASAPAQLLRVPNLTNPTFAEQRKRDLQALAEQQRAYPDELIELTADDIKGCV